MILFALAAALAGPLTSPPAKPQPGTLHTYKDWTVGCDNIRTCQANALVPEDGDQNDYLMLLLERDGSPGATATLDVPLPDKTAPGAHLVLAIDGAPAAPIVAGRDPTVKLALTRKVLDLLATGKRIGLTDAQGKSLGAASLAGLAASLLAIDDAQHRIGTTGALKATGPKPDTAMAPLAPLIVVPAASIKPPRTIGVALATKLIGPDNAKCEYSNGKVTPHAARLDDAHSVVVIDHPCGNGAYNMFSTVYVVDEAGTPHPARFDTDPGMGSPGDTDLTNGGWDEKSRRLSSFAKGRGIGDCGTSQTYAWDGTRFRMTEMAEMGDCRGSVDYIRIWTARTSR